MAACVVRSGPAPCPSDPEIAAARVALVVTAVSDATAKAVPAATASTAATTALTQANIVAANAESAAATARQGTDQAAIAAADATSYSKACLAKVACKVQVLALAQKEMTEKVAACLTAYQAAG